MSKRRVDMDRLPDLPELGRPAHRQRRACRLGARVRARPRSATGLVPQLGRRTDRQPRAARADSPPTGPRAPDLLELAALPPPRPLTW